MLSFDGLSLQHQSISMVTGVPSCRRVCLQVPGSVLKQMPPPSGSVGGVAGLGGGVFPPQLSPQHIAMLSSIYPPHLQFQLVRCSSVHQALQVFITGLLES